MQQYQVTVQRLDTQHAEMHVRNHTISTGIRRADPHAGPNAVETLLAALGTCLLTNVNTLVDQMRLVVTNARVELSAIRQDQPPMVTYIQLTLFLASPEPRERLETMFGLAQKWGTVSNTLARALDLEMVLVTEPAQNSATEVN